MERSTPTFLFNFPKRERERARWRRCLPSSFPLPLPLSVYFSRSGGTGGKSCWRIDSRATSTSSIGTRDGHRTWKGSSGETERRHALLRFSRPLSERWQPSCGAFYSRSTCRIVFEVALNVRDAWRETKCDWHLGEEKNIPPPPSFLLEATKSDNEAKKETTDDDHSWLFTRVANESSFSSADTSANRARHGYSISTGGGGRKGTPAQFPRRPKRIANGISLSRAI